MAAVASEPSIARVAEVFVANGRVIPGLAVAADGRARSWWWPLPAASDRVLLGSLLDGNEPADHARVAAELSAEVDRLVRSRFVGAGATLIDRRAGRRTVPDAWLRSLTSADPWLSPSLDPGKVRALAAVLDDWVRSGVVGLGRARLCLRIHEPTLDTDRWDVEALAQDVDEPSLVVSLAEVWGGASPFGADVLEELLGGLGRMARIAPELAGLLDGEVPDRTTLDGAALVGLFRDRVALLAEAGIAVLLPSWWTNRGRLGLRARTTRAGKSDTAVVASGFGLDAIVSFTWEAALGDRKLTKADLEALRRAGEAKRSLVRLRGMWVEVRPDEIAAVLVHAGTPGQATAGELVRTGLGLDALVAPDGASVVGVAADGWLGTLLDDAMHATVTPVPTPDAFVGRLRPYQERGVGWLSFLGRLGLGACLADDMGLGKTAQLIAAVLADRIGGPTLVVCPASVLGNWERELERFAPSLRVLVHHGPDRFRSHDATAGRAGSRVRRGADHVLTGRPRHRRTSTRSGGVGSCSTRPSR